MLSAGLTSDFSIKKKTEQDLSYNFLKLLHNLLF